MRFWSAFALGRVAGADAIPAPEGLASDGAVVSGWWAVGKEAADAISSIRERLEGQ